MLVYLLGHMIEKQLQVQREKIDRTMWEDYIKDSTTYVQFYFFIELKFDQ